MEARRSEREPESGQRVIRGGSEVLVLESNQNHATVKDTEVCPTLSASMGLGGGYVPMIVEFCVNDDPTPKVSGGACATPFRNPGISR